MDKFWSSQGNVERVEKVAGRSKSGTVLVQFHWSAADGLGFTRFGFSDLIEQPYKFIRILAMDVTNAYRLIRFGAMDVTKPYEFTRFVAMDVTKPYKFIRFGGHGCHQTL